MDAERRLGKDGRIAGTDEKQKLAFGAASLRDEASGKLVQNAKELDAPTLVGALTGEGVGQITCSFSNREAGVQRIQSLLVRNNITLGPADAEESSGRTRALDKDEKFDDAFRVNADADRVAKVLSELKYDDNFVQIQVEAPVPPAVTEMFLGQAKPGLTAAAPPTGGPTKRRGKISQDAGKGPDPAPADEAARPSAERGSERLGRERMLQSRALRAAPGRETGNKDAAQTVRPEKTVGQASQAGDKPPTTADDYQRRLGQAAARNQFYQLKVPTESEVERKKTDLNRSLFDSAASRSGTGSAKPAEAAPAQQQDRFYFEQRAAKAKPSAQRPLQVLLKIRQAEPAPAAPPAKP